MDNVRVLYCEKCGWYSEPNVVIKNQCPFCRYHVDKYWSKWGEQFRPVTLSYVEGNVDEVNEFIEKNLRTEKEDAKKR